MFKASKSNLVIFFSTFLESLDQANSTYLVPSYHLMPEQIIHLNKSQGTAGNRTPAASLASERFIHDTIAAAGAIKSEVWLKKNQSNLLFVHHIFFARWSRQKYFFSLGFHFLDSFFTSVASIPILSRSRSSIWNVLMVLSHAWPSEAKPDQARPGQARPGCCWWWTHTKIGLCQRWPNY